MLVLGIDSAGGSCGACVWQDGKILAEAEEHMERGQDQRLMPLIQSVMQKAGVDFDALDRIACTTGPGSFTGIRIGLAAARGLGLAAGKPVIGIDRFAIYRAQHKTASDLLVVLESKRKELFCRLFHNDKPVSETDMRTGAEIAELIKANPKLALSGDRQPHKKNEAVICAALAAKADADDPSFLPRPLYLREADVTVKAAS